MWAGKGRFINKRYRSKGKEQIIMKKDRAWNIATDTIGLLFFVLVLLAKLVLKDIGTAYLVITVAIGVSFIVLQIRRMIFTLKKKTEKED
jgi:uncharacterized membrane protein HdeD (DUF308 family)